MSNTNGSSAGSAASQGLMNKPKGSDFLQQRLKAWQPILTPRWVVISFLVVAIIFVPLGFVLKAASDSVVEVEHRYTDETTVNIKIPKKMKPPIYVYYQLENFYQNHRRYVKSRDDKQLASGKPPMNPSDSTFADCDPLYRSPNGTFLWPCGLIANSYFNDVFKFDPSIGFDDRNIAWNSDKEKFKNVPPQLKNDLDGQYQWLNETYPGLFPGTGRDSGVENEHFIVWMRVAALPTFRKLYGRIHKELDEGDTVTVDVENNFPVESFDGKKFIVLSTTSWLGGKNSFLGIAYIVVGFVCLGLAGVFAIKQAINPRRPGDTDYLQWTQTH